MPTISTLSGVLMVLGLMIAVLVFVTVLVYMASRFSRILRIDLNARLFRLKITVYPQPEQESDSLPNTER